MYAMCFIAQNTIYGRSHMYTITVFSCLSESYPAMARDPIAHAAPTQGDLSAFIMC
jgi:hypothetical protein